MELCRPGGQPKAPQLLFPMWTACPGIRDSVSFHFISCAWPNPRHQQQEEEAAGKVGEA